MLQVKPCLRGKKNESALFSNFLAKETRAGLSVANSLQIYFVTTLYKM